MKIIRSSDIEPKLRPNGRTVKNLLQLQLSQAVEQMAVLHAHHPKGFLEELHYHAAMWEVFIFHEPARYLICGHEYTLAAGDVVVLEPGDAHGAVPVDHEVNITVLQLPPVSGDKVLMPASAA